MHHFVSLFTLQKKMESREYKTAAQFAEDVRLIFTNCYRYNPTDSDVVVMARKLQDVFEVKYATMPEETETGNGLDDSDSDDSDLPESESEDEDSEDEREQKIKEITETASYDIVSGDLFKRVVLGLICCKMMKTCVSFDPGDCSVVELKSMSVNLRNVTITSINYIILVLHYLPLTYSGTQLLMSPNLRADF